MIAEDKQIVIVKSEPEMITFAKKLSKEISPPDIIVINGNLGAGKTFLIKHILKNFQISDVTSPTFSLVNEYVGKYKIYHFDFYRIKKQEELIDLGINDYFNDDESITFIEWGNLFPEVLPKKFIQINIEIIKDNQRKISVKNEIK